MPARRGCCGRGTASSRHVDLHRLVLHPAPIALTQAKPRRTHGTQSAASGARAAESAGFSNLDPDQLSRRGTQGEPVACFSVGLACRKPTFTKITTAGIMQARGRRTDIRRTGDFRSAALPPARSGERSHVRRRPAGHSRGRLRAPGSRHPFDRPLHAGEPCVDHARGGRGENRWARVHRERRRVLQTLRAPPRSRATKPRAAVRASSRAPAMSGPFVSATRQRSSSRATTKPRSASSCRNSATPPG